MAIKQIRVGRDNFSYLIYCQSATPGAIGDGAEAALVDPGFDAAKALARISELGLELTYIINTHHHADHTAANQPVKKLFSCQILAHRLDAGKIKGGVDALAQDNEELDIGKVKVKIIHTPGHTRGGICLLVDDEFLLTGDTLFIGDCGRTDLPDGSNSEMFDSLNNRIKPLLDDLIVYPGHDYGPTPFDTLGNQKHTSKVLLARSLEEFSRIP
ncbi:MAG: MBL fold metallo-hydrolase [Thermoplasmata archaeon]|nr:MBL fold metallo-hydrolase [Thermoplasmata archaeon]